MSWDFNIWWFLGGLAAFLLGGAIVYFYRPIADNVVNGVKSYDKIRLIGVLISILGLVIMANLHTLLLKFLVDIVFKR